VGLGGWGRPHPAQTPIPNQKLFNNIISIAYELITLKYSKFIYIYIYIFIY
jgi:hypothetical protein